MASCSTPQWSNSSTPYVKLTVTESSSTGNTVTLSWTLQYIAKSEARTNGLGRAYSVVIDGATVKTGTYDINHKVGTYTIASGTKTVNRSTSARNVSFSTSFTFNITWSGVYGGTKSASGSIGIGATTSYTVSYNANGGSGAPGSQTKWYGTNLVLSTARPTRTGHDFVGWGDSASSTTASAQPGGTYTANANKTYYAVWKAHTYTVTYNANGGSGAPGSQTKTYGVTLKLSTAKPTRANYNFLGWGTSAASSSVAYAAGANYTANAAITLYAIWQLAYTPPRITGITAERCNSSGGADENGTYAHVIFNWACDKTVSSIQIRWKADSLSSNYQSTTISASGTSGKVDKVIGSGGLSTENGYTIEVIVSDSVGSSTYGTSIAGIAYIIDVRAGGKGIAFGQPANRDTFDVNMLAYFKQNLTVQGQSAFLGPTSFVGEVDFSGTVRNYAEYFDRFGRRVNNGLTNYTSSGIDPNTTLDELILTHVNTPMGSGSYMYIQTMFYSTKSTSANRAQFALPYSGNGSMYHRYYYNGSWSAWRRHVNHDELTVFNTNKVLWSGAIWLNGSQTITLSQAISAQPKGIVVVFSAYDKNVNTVSNRNFVYHFVPKENVARHPGVTSPMHMNSNLYGTLCSKLLYISDTKITGHDENTKAGTGLLGIKYDGRDYCVRYVIGV